MLRERLYLEIINSLSVGIYFVDTQRTIQFWSDGAEQITGYPASEIMGKRCEETQLNHIDSEGRALCRLNCPLYASIMDGKRRRARVFVHHRDGYRLPIYVNTIPVVQDGETVGAIEVFHRDTPTVYEDRLIEHLSDIATHDPLTKLPNRRYLEDFLQHRMEEFVRFERPFAVLFADIDDFSRFNNTYGHDTGDEVLKTIAGTIEYNTRKSDLFGRWGGEEFLGIFSINRPGEARGIVDKYLNLIRATDVNHGGKKLGVTMSMGVAVVRPGDTPEKLVERADRLMYQSKAKGKDCASVDEE